MADPTPTPATPTPPPNPYATAPLPVPGALPPGNYGSQAAAIMNPIYDDAATRAAANSDALNRAIGTAQTEATQRVNSVGAGTNAPSNALAQVNSIPQAALANIQNRAMAYQAANNQQLAGGRTAETAGLANNLNAQQFAGATAARALSAKLASTSANNAMLKYQLMTPYEQAQLAAGQAKSAQATTGAIAALKDAAGTALQKMVDPSGTGTIAPGVDVLGAKQQVLGLEGNQMSALGVSPQDLQNAMNQYIGSLRTQSGKSGAELTGSMLNVNGQGLPSLSSFVPGGVTLGSDLQHALDDYQTQANQVPSKAAFMNALESNYGSTIANQVRAAARAAGSSLGDYLRPKTLGSTIKNAVGI